MENIATQLTQTKTDLMASLNAIPENRFNDVPFAGSWTAGQVAEHLLKANNVDVLYADTDASKRTSNEKIQAISDIFLNFELKLVPPAQIIPSNNLQQKQDMISKLTGMFDKLINAANTLELNVICTSWVIPAFGPLTRLEFLWLYNAHTIRHTRQIQNIAVALPA
ncbi:DinB family protein [Mucilaginibacter auburnensis]|uniref:DinB family protein n=1 Tax=Mucilaginibacter auburnensis TaxID=1457233 RepID=A0A2H9VVR3_9SPHI|nr:DinB family protein [Mucilaginibacter auburnensis]PJJ84923.1 DinB family protein [Mucilaginibacter auburnensis]